MKKQSIREEFAEVDAEGIAILYSRKQEKEEGRFFKATIPAGGGYGKEVLYTSEVANNKESIETKKAEYPDSIVKWTGHRSELSNVKRFEI